VPQRLVFRLADRHDYGAFGLRAADVGELPSNRAVDAVTGLHVQIAEPPVPLGEAVAAAAAAHPRPVAPRGIGVMPEVVALADVVDAAALDGDDWLLPLGIGDDALAPAGLRLGPGDHALVVGPSRSGKSTCLTVVAALLAKHRPDVRVEGVALRRSPLRSSPYPAAIANSEAALAALVEALRAETGPAVLLVDDADATDDPGGLADLLAERRDTLRVVAAGRADTLRTTYGHWTAELRRSRQGVALRPNIDLDGDLWHTPLPRSARGGFGPGRGYLVGEGSAELLQVALP
jgi:S-DNA-T family DNA segregation ATPase FtsK/SpoIIIE